MKALVSMLLALVSFGTYAAGASCTYYTRSGFYVGADRTSGPQLSREQACVALGTSLAGVSGYTSWDLHNTGGTPGVCSGLRYDVGHPSGESFTDNGTFSWTTTTAACPVDPCDAVKDSTATLTGTGTSVPASGCYNKCEYKPDGVGVALGGTWVSQGKATGVTGSCGGGPAEESQRPNCISSSKGIFCASKTKRSCGTINGETVCLDDVPHDNCVLTSDGGAVCGSSAGSPPAPDDGDEGGGIASADLELKDSDGAGGGDTYNYYTSTTVQGSTSGASGDAPGSAGGTGSVAGEGEDGSVEGPDGYGDAPSEWSDCASNIDGCVQAQLSGKVGALAEGIPLLAFAAGLDAAFSSAPECPMVQMHVFEADYDVMAPVCEVVEGNRTMISLVFQIGWAFCGLRILMKAQQ